VYVPPWTIFAGLGALERRELCNLIANFEATTLLSMSIDRAIDVAARFKKSSSAADINAFAKRLGAVADSLFASTISDRALRIRLWIRMAEALNLANTLPLSTKMANSIASAASIKAASIMAAPIEYDNGENVPLSLQKAWQTVKSIGGRSHHDFATLVTEQAQLIAKAIADATTAGELSAQSQSEIAERIRDHIHSLPPELRDNAMRDALQSRDRAALTLLATGTTAFSIGVGVNLAGFSAYILAAQASAFIPFMSGPAVVSTLFMLANPVFSIPAVLSIGYFANRHVSGGRAAKLAATICVQLSLRGLSAERDGLAITLNDFRGATASDLTQLPVDVGAEITSRTTAIANTISGGLSNAQGNLCVTGLNSDRRGALLEGVLSRNRGEAGEIAVVAGLSAGDILYNAVSIDPMVLGAADFSRSEDIGDIFQFSAFAEHIGSMTSAAANGAENNLRGYVSEQLVAARLTEVGHVVSFPDASNNPGFDLLVDGMPFQVKCLQSIDGLKKHFSKYPDMPVYANSELAQAVIESGAEWARFVFYVDGFDREIADLIMVTSLEAAEAIGDLNVPYFAMAVSSARILHRVWRGRVPLSDLPFSMVMDAGVKGGLSAMGALSGKTLGLMMFGPAGALVLGGVGGVGALAGAGWTKQQATRLLSAEWHAELNASTEKFRIAVLRAVRSKLTMLREKKSSVPKTRSEINDWIDARFADDIISLGEVVYDLEALIPTLSQPAKARACLSAMDSAKVHPLAVEAELMGLLEILGTEPSAAEAAGKKAVRVWTTIKSRLRTEG
jgi:hypothetical protein